MDLARLAGCMARVAVLIVGMFMRLSALASRLDTIPRFAVAMIARMRICMRVLERLARARDF